MSDRICSECGKGIPDTRSKQAKTCSEECATTRRYVIMKKRYELKRLEKNRIAKSKICSECGKSIPDTRSKQAKTCSEECATTRSYAIEKKRYELKRLEKRLHAQDSGNKLIENIKPKTNKRRIMTPFQRFQQNKVRFYDYLVKQIERWFIPKFNGREAYYEILHKKQEGNCFLCKDPLWPDLHEIPYKENVVYHTGKKYKESDYKLGHFNCTEYVAAKERKAGHITKLQFLFAGEDMKALETYITQYEAKFGIFQT